MKKDFKLKKIFVSLLFLTFVVSMISSCSQDEDNSWDYVSVATIRLNSDSSFYYILKDETTVYPYDLSSVFDGYKPSDSTRCFIWYRFLDKVVDGYNHTAKIVRENEILTKRYIEYNPTDSLNDDEITIKSYSINGGFLDIEFNYPKVDNNANIVLVHNEMEDETDDYTHFKIYFDNGGNNTSSFTSDANVSFNLGNLFPSKTGRKGIKFNVNTIEDKDVEYVLDY